MLLEAITLCFLNFNYAQGIVDSSDHFKMPELDLNHLINLTKFQVGKDTYKITFLHLKQEAFHLFWPSLFQSLEYKNHSQCHYP